MQQQLSLTSSQAKTCASARATFQPMQPCELLDLLSLQQFAFDLFLACHIIVPPSYAAVGGGAAVLFSRADPAHGHICLRAQFVFIICGTLTDQCAFSDGVK